MTFPADFIWGAATAAYQIEGAATDDGRKPSVWDIFCRRPGAIWNSDTGDVACNHYHRFAEDVRLMRELGLRAYRFSISWPRVIPDGTGAVNAAGLDFYSRLIDELLAAGIQPFITLYHWDLPQALYERGGWLNRESTDWFAEYTAVVAQRLTDRVRHWMTFNEIQVFLNHGMLTGEHAPGDQLTMKDVLLAGHNVLRAHGCAVQAIRATGADVQVGFAPVGNPAMPESNSSTDVAAARKRMYDNATDHVFNCTWWLDPIFRGEYPDQSVQAYGDAVPEIEPGDMELIAQPLDFLGLNIYFGERVRAGSNGSAELLTPPVGDAYSPMGFWVVPESLYWGPRLIHERYPVPIYITENGIGLREWVQRDGQVHDPHRIDYLHRYISELRRAMADGVDVRGYFHWSLLDNFEWAYGYRERFGLIYVDYETQQRIPKDSARWYQRLIETNGGSLDD